MAPVNLGTARLVIVVALIAVGIAVLSNGFGAPGTTAAGPPASSPSPGPTGATGTSPSPSPTPEPEPARRVTFAVFNGTEETGLAADAADFLEGEGYRLSVPVADAPQSGVTKTIVYFRGGDARDQNKANAAAIVELLGVERIKELGPDQAGLVTNQTEIVIVLGADYEFKS
jgi:hypothetical protein